MKEKIFENLLRIPKSIYGAIIGIILYLLPSILSNQIWTNLVNRYNMDEISILLKLLLSIFYAITFPFSILEMLFILQLRNVWNVFSIDIASDSIRIITSSIIFGIMGLLLVKLFSLRKGIRILLLTYCALVICSALFFMVWA
jgi:hypothetical protein